MSLPLITTANAVHLAAIASLSAGFVSEVKWSPDGNTLAVAHGSGFSLWMAGFGGKPDAVITTPAPVKAVAFSPDARFIAAAGSGASIQIYDKLSLEVVNVFNTGAAVNRLAYSPNSHILAGALANGHIAICTAENIKQHFASEDHSEITRVVFLQENRIITSGWDGKVTLWSLSPFSLIDFISHQPKDAKSVWARDVCKSSRGLLAAGFRDGKIVICQVDEHGLTFQRGFLAHEGGAHALEFSPNGRLLISGGRDHAVKVWDAYSGELITTLAAHRKPVQSIAFHPQGHLFVTAGGDHTIHLWGVAA